MPLSTTQRMTSPQMLLVTLTLAIGCATPSTPVATDTGTYPPTTAALAAGGASGVYVGQTAPTGRPLTVSNFAPLTSGLVSAESALIVPQGNFLYNLTNDRSGQLYVPANDGVNASVLVYAANANASSVPVRTITGGPGSFVTADFLAVDGAGQLYVYDCCVVDPVLNMYVDGPGSIYVFPANASGQAAPIRVISGPLTGLQGSAANWLNGMAVDTAGTIYVAVIQPQSSPLPPTPTIIAFSPTANGNVAPSRVITTIRKAIPNRSPDYLYLTYIFAIASDTAGNLYAAVSTDATDLYDRAIVEFPPDANGIATPVKLIAGTATGLQGVIGLKVDNAGNVFVSQTNLSAVVVEGFGASGANNLQPAIQFNVPMLSSLPGGFGEMALY